MKKVLYSTLVLCVILLAACGGKENKTTTKDNQVENISLNDKCLDFAITEKYRSLDPINVTDVASFHIASQIFEALLRFNEQDLSIEPLLAESWEVADDNLTHTFKLKKGVYFHDNPCFEGGKGREMKATDVLYTFKRIYSGDSYSKYLFNEKIAGSKNYDDVNTEIAGINVIDDYTIEFKLSKPSANFINLMATISSAIVAKEAIEANAIVGTGPFTYQKEKDNNQMITLSKNNNYYLKDKQGNSLPYLDGVAFNYIEDGQEQLDMFMDGKLDVITGLPSKSIRDIVEKQIADFQDKPVKYVLGRYPQTATTFITLNTAIEPFNNKKVRKAFNLAIDKEKIVNDVLKGEAAAPGNNGIVTPAIANYDYSSVIGSPHNIEKAKQLLKEAGFENGIGLPTLILATGKGNTSVRVGLEVQKQLKANLGVNIELSSMTLTERKKTNAASKNHMSIDGWLAEFPDPLSFLSLFYGSNVNSIDPTLPSYPNESRFRNVDFDNLYKKAWGTLDQQKRFELCLQADQIIANEVPAIPLWYHEDYHLIQSSIKGYYPNPMNIQYLTYVKIENDTPAEKSK